MTSSETLRKKAHALIETITERLSEETIHRQIDEPIDRALSEFKFNEDEPVTVDFFFQTAAQFVRYLYDTAIRRGSIPTKEQANDEVVFLLQYLYQGQRGNGLEGAILDALPPKGAGPGFVLAGLAQAIKAYYRQLYRRWVQTRFLDPSDWDLKCAMADLLLSRGREVLPPELHNAVPEQMADHVFRLIEQEMESAGNGASIF